MFDHPAPHTVAALPGGWGAELDKLQRLLVVRCVAPDKLVPAIQVLLITVY